jgi:putative acetyltransferase
VHNKSSVPDANWAFRSLVFLQTYRPFRIYAEALGAGDRLAVKKALRMMLKIRKSTQSDLNDVLHVESQAFGNDKGSEIADLVKGLLSDPSAMPLLSLLAVNNERSIGHILFTKARINNSNDTISVVILAPLAVVPEAQSLGVGGQLIEEGLRQLSETGVELVFVLGHPEYYPQHGFQPAGSLGFEAPYPIPDEHANAWMVQELLPGVIGNVSGNLICADVLNQPEHWRE